VFNGLSLHRSTHRSNVFCDRSSFFFFFSLIIFIIIINYFIFFCIPQTNYCSPGVLGFSPYPQQCEGHASRLCGGVTKNGVGGIMDLGGWSENINAWVLTLMLPCNPSLKCSRIIGDKVQTRIGCVRGQRVSTVFTVFNGFQLFSIVLNGFQWVSMVFNSFQQS